MKRGRLVVAIRRCVQLSVIALLVVLPVLSQYGHYRAARAIEDLEGTWRGTVFTYLERTIGAMPDPQALLDKFVGGLWSMKLFGVSITDPLAVLEMTAASRAWHPALWISLLIPVVLTVLLGRVFCAWICPMHLLLEITNSARRLVKWAELPSWDIHFGRGNKYLVLGLGLVAVAVLGTPLMALIYPPAVIGREIQAGLRLHTLTAGASVILGIALFELLISRRWWCRYVCPGGAVYSLLGAYRAVRVRRAVQECTACAKCITACEMGLRPMVDQMGAECDNCGDCVKACPEGALGWVVSIEDLRRPGEFAPGYAPGTAPKAEATTPTRSAASGTDITVDSPETRVGVA